MLVTVDKADILRLAQIVREETGNHVQEKNYAMLESRIRAHILKLGFKTIQDYWTHFQANEKSERELLQSLMTTHYTFFFREYAHFELLEKWIGEEIDTLKSRFASSKEPLRVWSAACSRGQEVYSLAMFLEFNLLKKHGVPFEIVGTDIDAESVAHAKNGVYSIQEVNTIPHSYLEGYWKRGTGAIKEFAAVHPNLKSKTKFETLNLFEVDKLPPTAKYDVIFCRNVFIYFSDENVRSVANSLAARLNPRGLLISGMSEPLRFPGWSLAMVGPSCYQKTDGAKPQKSAAAPAPAAASPRAAATSPSKVAPVAPIAVASDENAPYQVLCVDDSPTIQMLIKKIFSGDPLCKGVDVAGNGREAREKLDSGKYNLITLDIHMPEVNGIEFLEQLYNRKTDPPVLMISSVNRKDLELATKSLSLGAFDYVEKPAMNNLQKSTDEIRTKAKLALRFKGQQDVKTVGGFDSSIGQKLVVPDASQCLRVVVATPATRSLLEQVVRGQKNEYRSPALLIVWTDSSPSVEIEADLLKWTDRQISAVRTSAQMMRPNQVFLVQPDLYQEVFKTLRAKSLSIQVLDKSSIDLTGLAQFPSIQLLVDEKIADYAPTLARASGIKVSDVTPATSFPSLSVEYFANLRKTAA